MSDRRLYNRIYRYLTARADRVGTGDLDERSPLQLVIRGESLSARIYQRYNGTKVLVLDLYVDEIETHPRATHWVATRSVVMPFCALQIDRRRGDGSARLLVNHTLIANTVTGEILDEVLSAMIDRARLARRRVAEIVEAIRQDQLDEELAALLDEGVAELEAEDAEYAEDEEADDEDAEYAEDEEADEDAEYAEDEEVDDDEYAEDAEYAEDEEADEDAEYAEDEEADEDVDDYVDDEYTSETDDDHELVLPALLTGEQVMEQLGDLIGLSPVKEFLADLQAIYDLNQRRIRRGLPDIAPSPHLVFTGNPGTGKTTVARLIGALYRSMGMLESGHVVEACHTDLVASYVGQTGPKTRRMCNKALGGVLFIDEAYALIGERGNGFGEEALAELITFMENHRGEIVMIFAGYPEEMERFIDTNPGLKGRIDQFVTFPDYSSPELLEIFDKLIASNGFILTDAARKKLMALIAAMERGRGFANARAMRQLFNRVIFFHARHRKTQCTAALNLIDAASIPDVTDDEVPGIEEAVPHSPTRSQYSHGGYL